MQIVYWRSMFSRIGVLFFIGLAVRLVALYALHPAPIHEWFAPFVTFFLQFPSIDPWTSFLQSGAIKSFPYGIVMLALLTPFSWVGYLCNASPAAVGLGIGATLLVADIAALVLLLRLLPDKKFFLMAFWWLSPLVLTTNLWVGQLDVVPVVLLMACILCLKEKRYSLAGVFLSLALSAKLSMALAVPLVVLYFIRNKRMWPYAAPFFLNFVLMSLVLLGLPLLSSGYNVMTLGTSELNRLFDLRLPLGGTYLYLTPVLLVLVVYAAWRTSFLSFDLLAAYTALCMMAVVLATSTPPGWQLWAWPFLLMHLSQCKKSQRYLGYSFALLAAASQIFFWAPPINISTELPLQQGHLYGVVHTVLFSMGAVLIIGILRSGIRANDIYRFSKKPISIAVAGDSGVGKDTLAESIIGVLGPENTAHISGDDYHHWDRKSASWQIFTHLSPRANDLKQLFADVTAMLDGKKIVKRHYRHTDGRFSNTFCEEAQLFFIASGLHMLISKVACAQFDVRVFLDMEDNLRMYFKCRRDAQARGHSIESVRESIEKRKPDGERYIEPQRQRADIVFVRRLVNPKSVDMSSDNVPPTLLEIQIKQSLYHDELVRQLIGLCGLRVDMDFSPDMQEVTLTVDGDIRGEDMAYIASRYLPELEELLAVKPVWRDGVYGLMQLVILFHLTQKLKAR